MVRVPHAHVHEQWQGTHNQSAKMNEHHEVGLWCKADVEDVNLGVVGARILNQSVVKAANGIAITIMLTENNPKITWLQI